MLKWLRTLWKDREGSALVEGTVLMPVLAALFFGVYEFSYIFYQQHLVSTGVRDAGRYLARVRDPTLGNCQTNARNLASTGSVSGGTYRRVTGWNPADVAIAVTGPAGDQSIQVTGSFTYAPLGFWGYFGFAIPTISVTHRERKTPELSIGNC
jgi:Flp pilus assembly protein TadG